MIWLPKGPIIIIIEGDYEGLLVEWIAHGKLLMGTPSIPVSFSPCEEPRTHMSVVTLFNYIFTYLVFIYVFGFTFSFLLFKCLTSNCFSFVSRLVWTSMIIPFKSKRNSKTIFFFFYWITCTSTYMKK